MENNRNRLLYRYWAPVYDRWFERIFVGARLELWEMAGVIPKERVLLAGIGTGQDLAFLHLEAAITGIDLSGEMLQIAAEKSGGRSVSLLEMNVEQLDFSDDSFDVVVLNLVLSVVENPGQAMAESVRVLKTGGRMLVFDKFLSPGEAPGWIRNGLNRLTSFFRTDINRSLEGMIAGLQIQIIHRKPSLFKGKYRIVQMCKTRGD